jgi:hypothetical protein
MGKKGNADFTLHITLVNFQTMKLLLYSFTQNDRCPEIAFSVLQNAENKHNEKLKK